MDKPLTPGDAHAALERMRTGDATGRVFETIVAAAEKYAALVPEYAFPSPQAGLVYATQNPMLAEVLLSARPEVGVVERLASPLSSLAWGGGERIGGA